MTFPAGIAASLAFLAALLCSDVCLAGLDEGLAALAKGDYATATKELRPLAERGDAEAQYRIGLMYEFGRGYPQDKAEGIAWLRKSAAQDNTSAQQELGVIYATGDGVAKDDAQAVAWFQKAAALDNPTAQFNLGLMYAKGNGVTRTTRRRSRGGARRPSRDSSPRSTSWESPTNTVKAWRRIRCSPTPVMTSPHAAAIRNTSCPATTWRRG